MAQLIKLYDYISRYETDIYQYSNRFARLKRQRWEAVRHSWENGETALEQYPINQIAQYDDDWLGENRTSFLQSFRELFSRSKMDEESFELYDSDKTSASAIQSNKTLEELKKDFLDDMLKFQCRWASSTIRNRSFLDKDLYHSQELAFYLQRFPDNYLVMYHPVFMVKNASIEAEVIMISPISVYCITFLNGKTSGAFKTDKGRFWFETNKEEEIKHINPTIGLNRMKKIMKSIFEKYNIELPIQNIVLSPEGYIEDTYYTTETKYIDARNFKEWFGKMRSLSSPIKLMQLKGAEALLQYCQSTYVQRPEWANEEEY